MNWEKVMQNLHKLDELLQISSTASAKSIGKFKIPWRRLGYPHVL